MRRAHLVWTATLLLTVAIFSTVHASDHLDGPRVTGDPQADITDVFAFTSPENPSHTVLAMGVTPFASARSTFSSQVDYVFRIRRVSALQPLTLDTSVLDVTCNVASDSAPQEITCATPSTASLTTTVGDTSGGGDAASPLRIFAGLRADPAFFDRAAALSMVATGRANFSGQNFFAGANILAIVVELDTLTALTPPADAGAEAAAEGGADGAADAGVPAATMPPILAVAAETRRRSR